MDSSPWVPLAVCDINRAGDVPIRYSERLLRSDCLWMSSSPRLLPGSCGPQAASFLGDSWWLLSCKRNVFLSFLARLFMTVVTSWEVSLWGRKPLLRLRILTYQNFPDVLSLKTIIMMINYHKNLFSIYWTWSSVLFGLRSHYRSVNGSRHCLREMSWLWYFYKISKEMAMERSRR